MKLAGVGVSGRRNLTGLLYKTLPAPEFGTGRSLVSRTLLLNMWASPKNFKLVSVSVWKSNDVVPVAALPEKQRKDNINNNGNRGMVCGC
ncbi:hypothetical protein HanRHA438_Chr13g0595131 [Helianthus annuus]|nr:hypothetical protein HanHA300_Chr13g0479241 [Helianthus annuus]KAJ0663446.1 hypothetical protein HanLR1_Chr13g0481311 [Helianthus annuus]KAJ0857883.1 hypothetical protein HanRHA438_Chr13g0595131 [Helianthus annuus]